MIPRLSPQEHLTDTYEAFLRELGESGFSGEIHTDYATRLVTATDNSVYQIVPAAVVYPQTEGDVVRILELCRQERFRAVKLSPRGGGTGTNGQSLCDGIIIDLSRHFRDILELNLDEGWVRVQPGVVLDQLNSFLAPHGVFFAPNLSPSSRATLGGMINTDACGKGSRIYGKTSEHVLSLRAVLADGSVLCTEALDAEQLALACERPGLQGEIYRQVASIVDANQERLRTDLPRMKRFLTGYDLAHVRTERGFDLGRVLAGSEGTLALLVEARLRLTPLPQCKKLVAIRYGEFDDALRAANRLVQTNPGAIETVDDTIVGLAKNDLIWDSVAHLIDAPDEPPLAAVNLVEFESDDPAVVDRKIRALTRSLDERRGQPGEALGYCLATEPRDIAALWGLRKKGVGLLGNAPGPRRPVPFVEDTAVPPEHLADYIRDFRAILDRRGLRYGMFGHVDVGCLHVRPALDLKDPSDAEMLRNISDEVVALVKKYGGVLWGEHGKGYRSEYTPTFFGDALYAELRKVKAVFDPHNQLNPGKLATPAGSRERLVSVDALKRGDFDRQIATPSLEKFSSAVSCNGNGACFDWNPDSVMCPSSKVTRERIHSPKGRAGILREWLRLMSKEGHDASRPVAPGAQKGPLSLSSRSKPDFSHEVYDAMNGCLACKACATQCPIHVDIPAMRADFLEQYHTRYRRPLKDYFVAALETIVQVLVLLPRVSNWLMGLRVSRWILRRFVGMVDTPLLSTHTLARGLALRSAEKYDPAYLRDLSAGEKARTVFVVQDVFTSYYETDVALAVYDLLSKMGKRVVFLPFSENGKGLHIKGFLNRFRRVARETTRLLREAADCGIPLLAIEPAVALTYRDEYPHELGEEFRGISVQLVQDYLLEHAEELRVTLEPHATSPFRLFAHCQERTFDAKAVQKWRLLFERLGLDLSLEDVGCCGMCGVFGHEAEHLEESRGVFEMSWKRKLPVEPSLQRQVLVTGHSCRSQVKRFAHFVPRHPAQMLADSVR